MTDLHWRTGAQEKTEKDNLVHEIHQSFGKVIDAQHDQPKNVRCAFDQVRHEVWKVLKVHLSEMENKFRNEVGTFIAKTKNETCRDLPGPAVARGLLHRRT